MTLWRRHDWVAYLVIASLSACAFVPDLPHPVPEEWTFKTSPETHYCGDAKACALSGNGGTIYISDLKRDEYTLKYVKAPCKRSTACCKDGVVYDGTKGFYGSRMPQLGRAIMDCTGIETNRLTQLGHEFKHIVNKERHL